MARSRKAVVTFKDFTGGLNLTAQRQDLQLNETPDCLDVDFDKRGGFQTRRGVRNVSTSSLLNGGYLVGTFSFGTDILYGISSSGRLVTWDGATATHVATQLTDVAGTTAKVRAVPWTTKLYFANASVGGTYVMKYWNGSAWTTLTNTANNNYSAPAGGNAPLSRLIAQHAGFMWWADTVESGTRHRSRVRFSHYLQPEDFADADYYDIDPDDQTDQITALVPFRNMMLVFKRRSVWGIYGTSRDDFVVERLSDGGGVWSQEGVAVAPDLCYWWSSDSDIFAFDGRVVRTLDRRLRQLVDDGVIKAGADHLATWAEGRLYLSLVLADGVLRSTYVLDPAVGSAGAWTKYGFSFNSMVWWRKVTGINGVMISKPSTDGIWDLNVAGQEQDYDGATATPVVAHYTTAWYTANDPALMKRFRRMYLTAACKDEAQMNVDVFYNFDESTIRRTLTAQMLAATGGMAWGDVWGGVWGGGDPVYLFDRLSSAGRCNAIKFKFYVTNHASRWWVDSFAIPYLEKVYR